MKQCLTIAMCMLCLWLSGTGYSSLMGQTVEAPTHHSSSAGTSSVTTAVSATSSTATTLHEQPAVWEQRPFRVSQHTFSIGGGYTEVSDTYLSPALYRGGCLSVGGELFRAFKRGAGRHYMQSLYYAQGGMLRNASRSGAELEVGFDYSFTYYYRALDLSGWQLFVGPQVQAHLGGIYNMRNANNPGQLKCGIYASASLLVSYDFHCGSYPLRVRLQSDVPVVGCCFSPEYGQSYYEIFALGHARGAVHATGWHNHWALREQLSLDIPIRRSALRITIGADVRKSHMGNNRYHLGHTSLMLGYVRNLYHIGYDELPSTRITY